MDMKYSLRSDTWIDNTNIRTGKIVKIFKTGFDARFDKSVNVSYDAKLDANSNNKFTHKFANKHSNNSENNSNNTFNASFSKNVSVDFNENHIFFSLEEENLHPCSVLIGLNSIEDVFEGQNISFGTTLNIAGKIWTKQDKIASTEIPTSFHKGVISTNIKLLANNLKLFGKKSILRTFISPDGKPKERVFIQINNDLDARKVNLDNFVEIIGVGEGLTPSVDDFFSGMLLADRFLSNNYIIASENFMNLASNKTTRQSVLQLQFAEQGLLSLRFERFLAKFLSNPIKSAEIVKLLNYGHTSGTDILSGVLFYFKSILK